MQDKTERARAADELLRNPTFQSVVSELRERATATFLNPASDAEAIEKAHQKIRALHFIESDLRDRVAQRKSKND